MADFRHTQDKDNVVQLDSRRPPIPISFGERAEREREYREQLDLGDKASIAMLHDGLGADPAVSLDSEDLKLIGLDLTEARADLMMAAGVAGRATDKELYLWLKARVAELDEKLVELAGGGEAA
jgi:hypothetical protein